MTFSIKDNFRRKTAQANKPDLTNRPAAQTFLAGTIANQGTSTSEVSSGKRFCKFGQDLVLNHLKLDESSEGPPQYVGKWRDAQLFPGLTLIGEWGRAVHGQRNLEDDLPFSLPPETLGMIKSAIALYADPKLPHSDRYSFPITASDIDDDALICIVYTQLELIFAALAIRMAQKGVNRIVLTSFGEFLPEVDLMIQSRIPFMPRYVGHLSDQIFAQMRKPEIMRKMSGAWGYMDENDDLEIEMRIKLEQIVDSGLSQSSATFEEL